MTKTLFPLNFSYSMLSDVFKCEMLFYRKHCQRLINNNRSGDLIAGGHIAKACELTRKAYYNDGIDEDEAITLGENYILEAEDTTHELKSNERTAFCFRKYFEKFKLSSNMRPVPLADGTFAIEYLFQFDLGIAHPEIPDTNICFKGLLDGLYSKPGPLGHKISVLDEKTTGSVRRLPDGSPDFIMEEQEFNSSGQFMAYHWAARQLGVKTDNTIIRRIPILQKFEEAYELNLPINSYMLENWEQSTIAKIEELKDKYIWLKKSGKNPQKAFFPVYNDACNAYRKPCAFKAGCLSQDGESEIISSFRQAVRVNESEIALTDYLAQLNITN